MSWFPVLLSSGESPGLSVSYGGSPGSSASCGEPPSGGSPSGSSGRGRGRRWWRAGWGALAVAAMVCGAVACSGGGGSASSVSVPPRAPGEASAGPSAQPSSASSPAVSGAPTAPGEVTAESLSDPDSGYILVSIPEGLDQAQREVVVAFVAHDRAAWLSYRAMDGDHSAVEAAAMGQALESYRNLYTIWNGQGLHASGVYRVTVQEIDVDEASSDTAVVFTCLDQHDMDVVKEDGTSGGRDVQRTFSHMVTLGRSSSGSWMVVSDERVGVDQC